MTPSEWVDLSGSGNGAISSFTGDSVRHGVGGPVQQRMAAQVAGNAAGFADDGLGGLGIAQTGAIADVVE